MFAFIFAISLCRFYLGRHSVDQILNGLFFGALSAHFLHNWFKPKFLEPILYGENRNHWNDFLKGFLLSAILIGQVYLIYLHVETNVVIPEAWRDAIK